jgi:ATP-dependent Clp protease protease subunit
LLIARTKKNELDLPKSREALIHSTLLNKRAVFLNGSVTEESARNLVAQLIYLELDQPGEPITMYITSGGGLVYAGLAIYDVMQNISSPVHTMCIGHAESMAAVLLASGEPGSRSVQPHARVMIHQPSLGVSKTTSLDVMIQAKEGERTKQRLINILAKHTNKSTKEVGEALDRNFYMNAAEANAFGIVDTVGGSIVSQTMKSKTKTPDSSSLSSKESASKEASSSRMEGPYKK